MSEDWIMYMTEELQHPRTSPDHELSTKSIYNVPETLTDVNGPAYKPKLVSLGPIHHLNHMDEYKHRALIQFLLRIAKSGQTLQDVLIAMRKILPCLLVYYDSPRVKHVEGDKFRQDGFLEMMICDGCFVLEVMLAEKRYTAGQQTAYDSVFGATRKNLDVRNLKRDMLLLENQLPFLTLTTLADINGSEIGDVNALIKAFYNIDQGLMAPTEQSFHILDIYRKILTSEGQYLPSYEESIYSATELRNVGVSFLKSNSKSYRDISFSDGILSLPPLKIDETTESLLLNLMAFERCHVTAHKEVTAYAFFMHGLINTADDVALLRNEEIILGWVGCDGKIAKMFNEITNEAILLISEDDIGVNTQLNSYCRKRTPRWRASFVQRYLKNPWVFISLLGGLFLLVLTIIQTVYTVLQYHHT